MNYKITEINQDQKWIAIEVDFGDGSPIYKKRMMAPMDSEESIHEAVKAWLRDYIPAREASKSPPQIKLKKTTINFTKEDLKKVKEDR